VGFRQWRLSGFVAWGAVVLPTEFGVAEYVELFPAAVMTVLPRS